MTIRTWFFRVITAFALWAFAMGGLQMANAAEWQWSVPDGKARAYLWIPPDCRHVRAVVVCNHNMLEQGILEHDRFRRALARLGFAEIWVVPAMDGMFEFQKGAGEHYQKIVDALADASGYDELAHAPAIPMGHSACASFPWNFAAWDKSRTLAVLSVKGDAPQTKLTGSGKPNADWGDHDIDGVPCLMVMGEYEWVEDRLAPLLAFQLKHPATPIAVYRDAGHGHFDHSDELIDFLADFIEKAAAARLPAEEGFPLRPLDPKHYWRIDRPHQDMAPVAPPAPYADYKGPTSDAVFAFDESMAKAIESHAAAYRGKRPQLVGFKQDGQFVPQKNTLDQQRLAWQPEADGMTFTVAADFYDSVGSGAANLQRWAALPAGTPLGHGEGPILFTRDVGPFVQLGTNRFRLQYGPAEYPSNGRNNDLWLLAVHPGDATYKACVQQSMTRVPTNKTGSAQTITFEKVPTQTAGGQPIDLVATTDAGLPVQFFVRDGPARVEGNRLTLLQVPPRAKWPVKVTVVAWQPGRSAAPAIAAAAWSEQTFDIAPSR